MKIFVTNLPWSTDRKAHIQQQLSGKGLDFEFVDCVIGKELTEAEIGDRCDIDRIRELNKNEEWFNRGIIGCSLTSQNIHRTIVERNLETAMLMEDDVLLPDNFGQVIADCERIIEPGDVILLFWLSWETIRFKKESRIELGTVTLYETPDLNKVSGGSATIFSREAAANMLKFNTPIRLTPDCWGDFALAGCFNRVLCAYPTVVDTADFMSTMEHGRFIPLRRAINRHRVFPFYQMLRYRRKKSKRGRQLAKID